MLNRNARIGLMLFAVYLVFYGGFVLINAISPATMESTPVAGLNLAILYGFSLIIVALVLSAVYGWLCREKSENSDNGKDQQA
ncbi:MAG: DUF485 domain-containing protein [Planctomycetaceae bacterium]|nr:DUF485 domain-containing protein [Planctomycetaceae bacterium]